MILEQLETKEREQLIRDLAYELRKEFIPDWHNLVTKEDLKMLIDLTNKRFDGMDKRFEELLHYADKRFEELLHYVDKRFEGQNKRFEEIIHYMDKRFEEVNKRIDEMNRHFRTLNRVLIALISLISVPILGGTVALIIQFLAKNYFL